MKSQNPEITVKHVLNYIVPVFKNQIFVILYIVFCLFHLEMYCDIFLIFECSHTVLEFRCLVPYSVTYMGFYCINILPLLLN